MNKKILLSLAIVLVIIGTILILLSRRETQDTAIIQETPTGSEIGLNVGQIAPDLKVPSTKEQEISLSSLQGKVVLLDFWASWCPPCRQENPNIVKAFHQFKDKKFLEGEGFTVYSVSLDKNKEAWLKAIEQDKLVWDYHVSDLRGSNSVPAAIYQVYAIPANFLLDGNRRIIAKNIRDKELFKILKENLK